MTIRRSGTGVLLALTLTLLFNEAVGEYRKLIPKCSNSCLTSGSVPPTNCFCDGNCSLVYNDCCLDSPFRNFRVTTRPKHNINCVFVHGENMDFWMVDNCKESWSGRDYVREKCSEASIVSGDTSDINGALPVTNPVEGVTYKNYYCAICNEEEPENLIEWQVKALCSNADINRGDILENLTFVEDTQQWGIWKSDQEFHECYLLFEKPPNVTNGIRPCLEGMISSCPRSWQNIATRRKCKSYLDPIKWKDGPVYRNIDCAVCHNETREGFQCLYDVTRGTSLIMLSRAMPVDLSCIGQWL